MPQGQWDQSLFNEAIRNKMQVQQQNAASEATKANAAMESVQQQQTMQDANNAAAMARAQLGAQTSLQSQSMQNQGAADVAGINARSRMDVANVGEQGANYRTGLTTGTQQSIAGMEDLTKRAQLAQQNQQFGQTLGLDTAKAQESAIQGRAMLGVPEMGNPTLNLKTSQMESTIKRPAITNLAPSPLSTLGSGNGLGMESDDTLRKIRAQLSQPTGQ